MTVETGRVKRVMPVLGGSLFNSCGCC